jgi:hypothetical protein
MTSLRVEVAYDGSDTLVHRFRNFGQDVCRELRDICSVSIEEIDRSTTHLEIHEIKPKNLGKITQIIKRLLNEHHFSESGRLSKIERA